MDNDAKANLYEKYWCGINSNLRIMDTFDNSPSSATSCSKDNVLSNVNTVLCNLDTQCDMQCTTNHAFNRHTSDSAAYIHILKPLFNLIACDIQKYDEPSNDYNL